MISDHVSDNIPPKIKFLNMVEYPHSNKGPRTVSYSICPNFASLCLFVLLLYVPSQQLWSLRDGQFT